MDFMKKPFFPSPILDVRKLPNTKETGFVTGIWLIYRGKNGIGKAVERSLKENSALATADTTDSNVDRMIGDFFPFLCSHIKYYNKAGELVSLEKVGSGYEDLEERVKGLVDEINCGLYDDQIDPKVTEEEQDHIGIVFNILGFYLKPDSYPVGFIKKEKDHILFEEKPNTFVHAAICLYYINEDGKLDIRPPKL